MKLQHHLFLTSSREKAHQTQLKLFLNASRKLCTDRSQSILILIRLRSSPSRNWNIFCEMKARSSRLENLRISLSSKGYLPHVFTQLVTLSFIFLRPRRRALPCPHSHHETPWLELSGHRQRPDSSSLKGSNKKGQARFNFLVKN